MTVWAQWGQTTRMITLANAIDQFLRHVRDQRGLARHTLVAYEADLMDMLSYLGQGGTENLRLADVSTLHVKDYVAHLRNDRDLKPKSIARHLSSARQLFAWCVRREMVDVSPAENLRNPKIPKRLPHYLVTEEIGRLLRVPEKSDAIGARNYAILVTFLFTGMRLSELTGLNLDDLDFEAGAIRVRGKGSKERLIPPHQAVSDGLLAYIRNHRPSTAERPEPVFLSRKRTRMTSRMAGWVVRKAVQQAGLSQRTTPHKLRHTFATQLLHRGANLLEIKELLGHSELATTSIYTHTNVDRLKKAVGKITL